MKSNEKKILRYAAAISGFLLIAFSVAMMAMGSYLFCRFGKAKAITPPASQHLSAQKSDFTVAFFGDFAMQSHVFIPVLRHLSAGKPDLAICVGDMFRAPQGGEGAYLTEMLTRHLSVPFCTIPGNHDAADHNDMSNYRSAFGNPYYYFAFGDTLFLMLNDIIELPLKPEYAKFLPRKLLKEPDLKIVGMDDAELAWLDNVLAHFRKDFRRCVFVMHVPPVIPDPEQRKRMQQIIVMHQIEKLVKKYPIDAIVSGHLHISAQSNFHGIPVYHVPCCGQTMRDKIHPNFGYLTLHFNSAGGIEATPHYLPGLERGRNYFFNYLVSEIPGNLRYYYCALFLFAAGIGLLAAARKLS